MSAPTYCLQVNLWPQVRIVKAFFFSWLSGFLLFTFVQAVPEADIFPEMPSTIFLKNDRAHLEKTSAAYRVAVKAVRNRCFGRAVLRTSRTEFSIERNKWMLVKKKADSRKYKGATHCVRNTLYTGCWLSSGAACGL